MLNRKNIYEKQRSRLRIQNRKSTEGMDDNITEVDRETLTMQMEGYKQEMEKLIEYKTKGSIIRSKTRWYNEGEKNTKYFLGLEKRHFNKKNYKKFKIREWQLCWLRQEDPRGSK